MKIKVLISGFVGFMMLSCGGSNDQASSTESTTPATTPAEKTEVVEAVEATEPAIDPMEDKGVGPITSLEIGELGEALVTKGEELFETKCTACHKMGKRFVGPDLVGVVNRRTPEWIMNMILDPEGMVKNNQAAKELLMEYSAPMANQSLEEEEARAIYEYFRTVEEI